LQLALEISSVHVPEHRDHAVGARVRPLIASNVEQDYEVSFDSSQTAMLLV
jgi:hypothetical protein